MSTLPENALVLYKTHPAKVTRRGEKPEIALPNGRHIKVRPKDVLLLHPGPVSNLSKLDIPPRADIVETWELLAGESVSLQELAELLYDNFSPAAAWSAWRQVMDGLYFEGTPQAIVARDADAVRAEQSARAAKTAEKAAWTAFLHRVETKSITPDDYPHLQDVETLALGRGKKSRLLRALNRAETPENAHALLLDLGVWDATVNPHPQRFGLTLDPPAIELPPLPDESRRDLTALPAFAIDDADSTDPDDAISWDGKRLWVHVADVAALIPAGSAADGIARARGANLYLPDGTIPMLPPAATEKLALGLSEVSPALSFAIEILDDGTPTVAEISAAWVKVTRLNYESAETQLATEPFATLLAIAEKSRARRIANGALDLDLPEVKVRVDDAGAVAIKPILPLNSRTLVREAMLLCGEAVARFAVENEIPLAFSTQAPPADTPLPPTGLARMFALRKLLSPAELKGSPGGHAGLGLNYYTQITSPLRRYGDLAAHQQLRRFLHGEAPLSAAELLTRIAEAGTAAVDVRRVERISNLHWKLVFLQQNPGWCGDGVVVEIQGKRRRLVIPALDLDIWKQISGKTALNDTVTLRAIGVDLPRLEAYFEIDLLQEC